MLDLTSTRGKIIDAARGSSTRVRQTSNGSQPACGGAGSYGGVDEVVRNAVCLLLAAKVTLFLLVALENVAQYPCGL
jgi:hypothetical protein